MLRWKGDAWYRLAPLSVQRSHRGFMLSGRFQYSAALIIARNNVAVKEVRKLHNMGAC